MMGVVAPIMTGIVVDWTQSFAGAFMIAGVVLLIGIFFYVVVLGPIEPIPDLVEGQSQQAVAAH
jgi:dipeptide/tripeptide permease